MPRRSINDLPSPPVGFNPAINTCGKSDEIKFEKLADSIREDFEREKKLNRSARRFFSKKVGAKILRLSKKLARKNVPASLASSRFMRRLRIKIPGWLWYLVEQENPTQVSFFTVIPKHWEIKAKNLSLVDPVELLAALRMVLIRCGADRASGWIFLCIHGEFEPNSKVFRIHVHGLATREMVAVIDRLRSKPNFRSHRKPPNSKSRIKPKVYQRVRMTRKPLKYLPRPITYVIQSFWPGRSIYENRHKETFRQGRKRRIPEPYHSQYLLWLDRWSIDDLILKIGLSHNKLGLKKTTRKTNKNGISK